MEGADRDVRRGEFHPELPAGIGPAGDGIDDNGRRVPKRHDRTEIGGSNEAFRTTCWTQIFAARADDESVRQKVLEALFKAYWRPVYCYLRRKGDDNEKAKDLTQGFFHEILLEGQLIARADRTRGRFRTFLLTALDHYRTNVHQKAAARKRRPDGDLFSLAPQDTAEDPQLPVTASPEEAFTYTWACELLDNVIGQVRQECLRDDKEVHWNVFRDRVLVPIVEGSGVEGLDAICDRYGIESQTTASNMIVTVKRRFHTVLKRCLGKSLDPQIDAEEELKELLGIFSRHRAG
jgi:DNA-directed RNA polymerase specialized sigma24 family protein